MDEAFLLRAKRLLGERQPVRFDHQSFLAEVSARQSAAPTSIASKKVNEAQSPSRDADTVATLVLSREEWRGAARAQGGCFNRAAAKRRVNTP